MATNTNTTATPSTTKDFTVSCETLQLGDNETNVLAYWKQINAFEKSNKLSKDRPRWKIKIQNKLKKSPLLKIYIL